MIDNTQRPSTSPPLFSVIIPCYNRASTIVRAIQSVIEQDLSDLEILVVDDGSSDNSVALMQAIEEPRLRIHCQSNSGASAARNRGIDMARGHYVAFLDSDDIFLSDHLSSLLEILEQSDRIVAYSPLFVDRGGSRTFVKPFRAIRSDESMADYLMRDRGFVQTSGLALLRETAARVRYREDMSYGDDTDFAVRIEIDGNRFKMAEKPTVIWTDVADSDRLSSVDGHIGSLKWLEDLRPNISEQAYRGYRGWHVAKGDMSTGRGFQALKSYFLALSVGSYSTNMAAVIFLQIFLPTRIYRWIANLIISLTRARGRPKDATARSSGGGDPVLDPDRPVTGSISPHIEA